VCHDHLVGVPRGLSEKISDLGRGSAFWIKDDSLVHAHHAEKVKSRLDGVATEAWHGIFEVLCGGDEERKDLDGKHAVIDMTPLLFGQEDLQQVEQTMEHVDGFWGELCVDVDTQPLYCKEQGSAVRTHSETLHHPEWQ
jgi:hypothetical protein